MKRLLFLASILLPLVPSFSALCEDPRIESIRAKYNATENARLSKRIIKPDDQPEMAELVKYYDSDGILVKMALTSGSDHELGTDYYYMDRGALYFVFQARSFWRFDPDGPEGTTIDTARERRIYYDDNRVIRHLVKEARSRNPEAVAGLLRKAENESTRNEEAEQILLSNSNRLLMVENGEELENFLFGE